MLKEFDHKKQLAQFTSAVEEAEKELERVIAQSERRIAQYVADLLTQSNTLTLNQKKLDRDRKNLDATKIYAPQDGLVVYNVSENRFSSESLIEEGATVRNRQELIKLPDVSRMKVTVKVHESYVNMITPGLPASSSSIPCPISASPAPSPKSRSSPIPRPVGAIRISRSITPRSISPTTSPM
jgi:HlyD family secretion protein